MPKLWQWYYNIIRGDWGKIVGFFFENVGRFVQMDLFL